MIIHKIYNNNLDIKEAILLMRSVVPSNKGPGPRVSFHIGHVVMTTLFISDQNRISRQTLAESLGASEGTVKTLIAYMQLTHIAMTSSSGTGLTGFGSEVALAFRGVVQMWKDVKVYYVATDLSAVAFKLRKQSISPLSVISLRDGVVKYGGTGATLAIFSNGKFTIPLVTEDLSSVSNDDVNELKKLNPKDQEIIVIVSARSAAIARTAFVASLTDILVV